MKKLISLVDAKSRVAISSIMKLGSPENFKLSFEAISDKVNGPTLL